MRLFSAVALDLEAGHDAEERGGGGEEARESLWGGPVQPTTKDGALALPIFAAFPRRIEHGSER